MSGEAVETARRVLTLREAHRSSVTRELGRAAGNGHRVLASLYHRPIVSMSDVRVRYLLVEAGWRIRRTTSDETAALRAWALGIAARRGTRIAVVAVARRRAGVLDAMWRDNTPYDSTRGRAHTSGEPQTA